MTSAAKPIRIGSRGSALARWQADHVAALLRARGHHVSIDILVTTGDRMQSPFQQVGTKGMFTREIEEALADGRIDLAVHSLKDLPTELADPFILAAIPERADARDAFVSIQFEDLSALPPGAVVGTSSLRRQSQLHALRGDLEIREMRGNVDTRLHKLHEGKYDAIVLAAAGLDRLGRTEWLRARFAPQQMCPAPGQGALAIECRSDDVETRAALTPLDHASTRFAVTLERAALGALGGGCHVPVGVYCRAEVAGWSVTAIVAQPDGSRILREHSTLAEAADDIPRAEDAGRKIARNLLEKGAAEILAVGAASPEPESARS